MSCDHPVPLVREDLREGWRGERETGDHYETRIITGALCNLPGGVSFAGEGRYHEKTAWLCAVFSGK